MHRWFIAVTLAVFSALAGAEQVEVFGAEDYPVVCFMKDGQPAGIFPAILKGVSAFSGDTYDLKLFPWKRAQSLALAGQGGVAHFSWTAERGAAFDFSDPVYGDEIGLLVLRGNEFSFTGPKDLVGRRVGAKLGASFGQDFDLMVASHEIVVDRDLGVRQRMHKLLLGRIDVAVVEGTQGRVDLVIESDPHLLANKGRFVLMDAPLVNDALFLAFAKSMHKDEVLKRFNRGLAAFKKTRAYADLIGRMP